MKHFFSAIMFLILWSSSSVRASTVVFVIDHNALYAASDSKVYNEHYLPEKSTPKIFAFGNVIFANTGMNGNLKFGFNVSEIARNHFSETNTLSDSIGQINSACSNSLVQIFNDDRSLIAVASPRTNTPALDIAFAKIENGFPSVYRSSFWAKTNSLGRISIRITSSLTRGKPGAFLCRPLGYCDEIYDYLDGHSKILQELDKVELLKTLIRIEISAHPDRVGAPIHFMKMDMNGVRQLPQARW